MKKSYTDICYFVATIFALVFVIAAITFCLIDASQDITSQMQLLTHSAQAVSEDFSKLKEIANAEATITDEKITIIFKDTDCEVTAVYNKDMELLSMSTQDMRIGHNTEAFIVVVAVQLIFGSIVGYMLAWIFLNFKIIIKKERKFK